FCSRLYFFECNAIHLLSTFFFFFQAEDGIRDLIVTGVQTCALPIYTEVRRRSRSRTSVSRPALAVPYTSSATIPASTMATRSSSNVNPRFQRDLIALPPADRARPRHRPGSKRRP